MEITRLFDFVIYRLLWYQFLVGRSCFEPIHFDCKYHLLESLKFAFGPRNLCQNYEFIFLTQQCV